jgi:hypothetical protein
VLDFKPLEHFGENGHNNGEEEGATMIVLGMEEREERMMAFVLWLKASMPQELVSAIDDNATLP